jgi:dihydrofolate reductase
MSRIRYQVACSLDGYIAGPDGAYDWIIMDPAIDFDALFASFDTVIMGRRSFEGLLEQGQDGAMGMATHVMSRTLRQKDHPSVTVVGENAAGHVAALKAADGKDIWLFGGGDLFASMLDAGLVDAVEVAIVPHLVGGGVPFLPHAERGHRLRLASCEALGSGIIMTRYDVLYDS